MKCTVLGCGRWGSFLACFHSRRHEVTLWGREGSRSFETLRETRTNAYLTLPDAVKLESDLGAALAFGDIIIISISAQQLRSFAQRINGYPIAGKTVILCMKGLEEDTGKRLTEVMQESITQPVDLAVWVGPGHVQDFLAGIPNCMVVDSADRAVTERIVEQFQSELLRLYIGTDLLGTEIGAAAKNVMGIAAGMLDGRGLSSLKGALMARGAREISRLIRAMGGNELSAYGLCHLGDYEATLFSEHSHNRRFGEALVRGERYDLLAEGVSTARALVRLGQQYGVELPICETVHAILYEKADIEQTFQQLFFRSTKEEFYC
ncbi:MAG TPA: NAD(P)H-dependent glycerol-3-phosphate dehydrogenase [Candidatus Pygmaiobacter gallistercoris]|nr:NAD(P)H-dependent glycerol-3-phosphate dehydrogenase [Candidatus Pygmaiobacter gallistercoris]